MLSSRKALRNAVHLNPRASNSWSKDESKFGKKLLEKMGWKEGQGLGVQNQGISENIKYRLKLDNKEDQWVEVRNEFSDLLAQLSQSIENDNELKIKGKRSLKTASESSRSRVHYHKFTHGKDISRYNKEDLIGILGEKKEIESVIPDKKEFIQSGNMEEYFENKKKKLQTNGFRSVKSAENVTKNLEPEEKQESVLTEPIKEKSTGLCSETRIMEKSSRKCDRKIDVKPLSKAERIVQKARMLKRLQSKKVTHAFTGTNLTEIPGYGNAPS